MIDLFGNIVVYGGEDEGNIYVEIDLKFVVEMWGIILVFIDRWFEFY